MSPPLSSRRLDTSLRPARFSCSSTDFFLKSCNYILWVCGRKISQLIEIKSDREYLFLILSTFNYYKSSLFLPLFIQEHYTTVISAALQRPWLQLDKWSSTCFLLSAVFTLICQTFSPSLSWEERRWTGDITSRQKRSPAYVIKKHRKEVSNIQIPPSIDSLISDVDSGEEERLPGLRVCVGQWGRSDWLQLITTSRQSVWAAQTGQPSPAGCHCEDIRRGHYHHSDTIIPLSWAQYKQCRGEGLKHLHFTLSVCQSDGEIILGQRTDRASLSYFCLH